MVLLWTLLAACGPPADPTPPATSPVVAPPPAPPESPAPPPPDPLPASGPFLREVVPGLVVAALEPPDISDPGFSRPPPEAVAAIDRRLFVVTIDPALHEVVYLSALQDELRVPGVLPADEWAARFELEVVFNPGMFEPDAKATGYTRAGAFVSQGAVRRNGLYRSWFIAGPGPTVAMLDQRLPKGSGTYGTREELPAAFLAQIDGADLVSQSLSILRAGQAVYPPRKNQWSELAYGVDEQGRLVVVFSRYPYEMREFGARVAALDLGIRDLLHGEGGPEASLVVKAGGVELIQMGSFETGFYDDRNTHLWGLPAVMAIRPRPPTPSTPAAP